MIGNQITLGSLFDGIAGFPLSASRYGIATKWASEIEAFPIKVSSEHFPDMKHLGDVTKINGAEIEPVNIVSFGSPCQDMSVAGKRAGLEGARSGLFMEAVRIIKEMRIATNGMYPRFAIWENVPGAFSSNNGQDFRAVLEEITETEIPMPNSGRWAEAGMVGRNGRSVAWRVLDAQYWGVPQRRKRIFLVADFRGECAGEILFEREGMSGNIEESGEAWEEVARGVGDGVGATGGCLTPWDGQGNRVMSEDGVGPVLRGGGEGERGYPAFNVLATSRMFYESGLGWIDECQKAGCLRAEGENRPSRPCHTIVEPVGFAMQAIGEYADTGKASTIKQRDYKDATDLVVITCATKQLSQNIGFDVASPLMESDYKEPQAVLVPLMVENHPADSRVKIDDTGTTQTLTSRMGTGGGNVPMLMQPIAFTANQRDEVRDLGDKAGVLQAQPGMKQQTFIAQAFGPSGSNDVSHAIRAQASKADKPDSTTYIVESWTAIEFTCECGATSIIKNLSEPCLKCGFICSGDVTYLYPIPINDKATRHMGGGSTRNHDGSGNGLGVGKPGDPCPTLTAGDRHAVAHAVDVRNLSETEELSGTLQSKNSGGYSLNYQNPVRIGYRVRRLTPTECLRLQGFPDNWLDIEGASDSAKYKAVGNSVAIPCVEFIFSQIVKVLERM